MTADAVAMDAGSKPEGGAKQKLLTLGDLDGRTRAVQMVRATITALEADLGGADHLTTGESQIVKRAALTGAMLEDLAVRWLSGEPVDPALYATLSNSERRLLETVGLKRRQRDVTPRAQDYLANLAKRASSLPSAAEEASA
jgi:hypothetical protein